MKKKMKHRSLLFIIGLLAILVYSCGPKQYVNTAINWSERGVRLDTALKAAEKATQLEETKEWPKTYYALGRVYYSIYQTDNNEFKNLAEKPLIKSLNYLQKAREMDDGSLSSNIDWMLLNMYDMFIREASNAFQNKNYEDAQVYFENAAKLKNTPIYNNQVDTVSYYNAGLAALNAQKWEEAIKYFNKSAELNYGGANVFIWMKQAYQELGDSTAMLNTLKRGFEKYQDNATIIFQLVNYYLSAGDTEAALKYINKAKEKEPDNEQLYFAEGYLYDKLDKYDKAVEAYRTAIEKDEDFFDAYYNLGVLYYNEGVDLMDKANAEEDNEMYLKKKAKADSVFELAIPIFEKAYELKPDDLNTMQNLKSLYYRFQKMEKYKAIRQKIQKIQQQGGGSQ
mgnify:CR=1 FL=1